MIETLLEVVEFWQSISESTVIEVVQNELLLLADVCVDDVERCAVNVLSLLDAMALFAPIAL